MNVRFVFDRIQSGYSIMDSRHAGFMHTTANLMKMTEEEVFETLTTLADREGYIPAKKVAREMMRDWYAQ